MRDYKELEKIINIDFKNKDILLEALTHSSYANEHNTTFNERLEFLGDAVLELLMSKYLFEVLDIKEGEMTKKRAEAVREEALFIYAGYIHLKDFIRLGNGEMKNNGHENPAIIADCFEALLGAIFEDQGFEVCKQYFNSVILPYVEELSIIDYKSELQELVQADKRQLEYKLTNETGPSHDKIFEKSLFMDDILMGVGKGKTKKEAEQEAARIALTKLVKK